MKAIWIFSNNDNKKGAVTKAASAIKAQVKNITPQDLRKPVGMIIGMPVFKNCKEVNIPPFYMMPELLLFSGITSDEMDVFLDVYKKQGVPPIALKAMATPFNVNWSLYELISELSKEHAAYGKK